MNRSLKQIAKHFGALVVLFFCSFSYSNAQTGVSPNLVDMSTGNSQLTMTGTVPYTGTGGGLGPAGSSPGYNSSTNTIYFGYTQSIVAYTYAFSLALQNSGMSILGYNYGWDYLNEGMSSGNLSANVNFAGTNGTSLHSKSWTLGPTTGWTNISGTETFTSPGLLASNISNFSLSFSGKDSRFWGGFYGPQVRNPSLSLNYTFDVCSSNPLSSPDCPGYAAAYLTQQCNANPLYNASCPGYAAAYLTQQCSINPLYNQSCPGYASAYLNYQCSINPLYSTTCEGYQSAYFNQQCSLDGLYSKNCPNYAEAYAKKNILNISTDTTNTTSTKTATTNTTEPTPTISSDGTVSTTVSKTGDSNVDKVISTQTTSTNSAATPAAPVQLTQPQQTETKAVTAAVVQEQKKEEKKDATTTSTSSGSSSSPTPSTSTASGSKDQPKTARQELQERREAAAKAKAVEDGKNLADNMGKAVDMEQQKMVQNVVLQAMSFVPGFDAYNKVVLIDKPFYKPEDIYRGQVNVDNKVLGRRMFGPSDQLHNEMVEAQYKK